MIRRRPLVSLFALMFCGAACAELPELPRNECGNGFVEPEVGEACDLGASNDKICYPPEHPNACHLVCDTDNAPCKANDPTQSEGWVCGLDHVCRLPAGTFEPSTTIPNNATHLLLSDLDGDKRKDIVTVGPTGTDVFFIGSDGQIAATRHIAVGTTLPSAGNLATGSETTTLAYTNTTLGYTLFDGRSDRTIVPRISPSFQSPERTIGARIIPADLDDILGTESLALLTRGKGTTPETYESALYSTKNVVGEPLYYLPLTAADDQTLDNKTSAKKLVPSLPTAFVDPAVPCPTLLVAYQGDSRVFVAPLCDGVGLVSGKTLDTPQNTLVLPPKLEIDGRVFLVDVDVDGVLDVLVSARCKDEPAPQADCAGAFYAKGKGDGTFQNLFLPYFLNLVDSLPLLAAADLNGDGGIDLVTHQGIHLTQFVSPGLPDPGDSFLGAPITTSWDSAVIDDFNSDGRPEVAAAESTRGGIDVYLNAGDSIFNPFSLPTESGVDHLTSGDFNGDLYPDLAFAMTLPADPSRRSLNIAAGAPSGGLGAPLSVGEVGNVMQLEKVDLQLPLRKDTASDMVIVTRPDAKASPLISAAFGDSQAGLLSPLLLGRPDLEIKAQFSLPLSSTIGSFGPSGRPSLAALVGVVSPMAMNGGFGLTAELWNMSTGKDDVLVPAAAPRIEMKNLVPYPELGKLIAVDIDGKPAEGAAHSDELVLDWYAYDSDKQTTYHPVLVIARADAAQGFVIAKQIDVATAGNGFVGPLIAGDVNGDGFDDVLGSVCKEDGSACNLFIFWNIPDSNFGRTLDLPTPITLPVGIPLAPLLLEMDGDPAKEILVINYEEPEPDQGRFIGYRVDFEGDSGFTEAAPMEELTTAYLAASGDVDGDLIDDIVTSAPGLVTIYRGKDRVP